MLNSISVVQQMASTFTNRLAHEKSPYLLQHKNDPVNWYPWGSEAFEEATAKNCPIFLSVGYSTCHWCHLMKKESFENAATAKYLNDHFISIIVDREERPDIDKLYFPFVYTTRGKIGWPMLLILTPKLAPIYGGAYFPPDDNGKMRGFPSILKMIHEEWEQHHTHFMKQGITILKFLEPQAFNGDVPNSKEIFNTILKYKHKTFESDFGKFGNRPKCPFNIFNILDIERRFLNGEFSIEWKFPKASDLDFLIAYAANYPNSVRGINCMNMLKKTLEAMSLDGIHDHIGKGFHRYSVDAEWHVPHFEKMLYDQAQLLASYSDFHRLCQQENKEIEKIIRDIFEYLEERLSHKDGGFYAAEDADSLPLFDSTKKVEGAFYVWEKKEVKKIIEENSELPAKSFELLCEYFAIGDGGNVEKSSDPHGELTNKNVLRRLLTNNECSINFGISIDELEQRIGKMKQLLSENRKKRPPPHLDSKIVTAWQGLAITGLVKGYQAVGDEKMLKRAEKCVEFVEKWLRNQENGELRRAVYRGENGEIEKGSEKLKAFSHDYAFYIQGLLDFYSVDGNDEILKKAIELQEIMNKKFLGPSGYFIGEEDCGPNGVPIRMIDEYDRAEPAATSIGIMNLLRLYDILEKEEYREKANQCFKGAAAVLLHENPAFLPKAAIAHNKWQNGSITVVLVGEKESDLIVRARQILNQKFLINLSVVFIDSEENVAASHGKSHEQMAKGIKPAVYICKGFVCDRPIRDVETLEEKLSEL